MANDFDSDKSDSPRISFSYDLTQSDSIPVEHLLRSCSSTNVDFNFCVQENSDIHDHASLADELFSNGKILPSPMKTETIKQKNVSIVIPPISKQLVGSEEVISIQQDTISLPREDRELKQQNSKSFFGFKRSSSYGSGNGRSLWPIALLSRSNSAGSSTGSKQPSSSTKEGFDRKYHRNLQKPPLRKTGYGSISSSNGIRVDPVLNLGSGLFFTGSSKNKTKK